MFTRAQIRGSRWFFNSPLRDYHPIEHGQLDSLSSVVVSRTDSTILYVPLILPFLLLVPMDFGKRRLVHDCHKRCWLHRFIPTQSTIDKNVRSNGTDGVRPRIACPCEVRFEKFHSHYKCQGQVLIITSEVRKIFSLLMSYEFVCLKCVRIIRFRLLPNLPQISGQTVWKSVETGIERSFRGARRVFGVMRHVWIWKLPGKFHIDNFRKFVSLVTHCSEFVLWQINEAELLYVIF